MATLVPVKAVLAGTVAAPVAAAGGGDLLPNPRGQAFVRVTNGGGGSINVTATPTTTARAGDQVFPPMTLGTNVVAVGAGATKLIGPFPVAYNDGNGNVPLTYSGVTSVTIESFDPSLP